MRRTMGTLLPDHTATLLRRPRSVRRAALVLALLALPVLALGDGLASAQSAKDERKKVQAEQRATRAEVDVLEANQEQISARLVEIDAAVSTDEATAESATRAAQASAAEAEAARVSAAESAAELGAVRDRLRNLAVSAYIDPPGDALLRRFEAESAQADATRHALLAMQAGRDVDLADQVRVIQRRHRDDLERAEASQAAAEQTAAAAAASVAALQARRGEQEAFASSVRSRLDARLADVANLERIDAGLAARIREEEAAVAAALRALAPRPASPSASSSTAASPRPTPPPPPLGTVGGITVNTQIADQLAAMIQAAAADGIVLGGSGYRSLASQIQLRRQHCGTTDFAIYEMGPDECAPPTARPTMSLHEQGLAVDLTANGRAIVSRTDPGFVWLAANASRFGFHNLPSEPWHWSITGG